MSRRSRNHLSRQDRNTRQPDLLGPQLRRQVSQQGSPVRVLLVRCLPLQDAQSLTSWTSEERVAWVEARASCRRCVLEHAVADPGEQRRATGAADRHIIAPAVDRGITGLGEPHNEVAKNADGMIGVEVVSTAPAETN